MRYRSQHHVLGWSGEIIQINNLDLLRDRIGYWMLRRTKAQVLKNLPPKLPPENRFVRMTVSEQKDYQELVTEFGQFLEDTKLSVINPLVKLLRMRQYCATPAIWGVERRGSKYEELVSIIKDWDGQIIVFCSFTEVTRLLRNWLAKDADYNPAAYIDGDVPAKQRVDVVNLFNEHKIGKVLLSSDAGRFGLNITSADLVIHYDQIFNPQLMEQREDRAHRIGQQNPVNVINLMYMDSVDYGIYLMNREEAQIFEDVVEGAEEAMIRKLTPARLKKIAEGRI
jgi:SNF2 family DNA or RNA helicase